jgi:peptidoglycan glycosyltransferase
MLAPQQFQRRIGATGAVALLAILVFFGALVYWQVFRTDLANANGNPRVLSAYNDPNRGSILDRDGNVLASSSADGTRHYNDADAAHIVGYLSAQYGSEGAELAYNSLLSGKSGGSWLDALKAEFTRDSLHGLDVKLTLDPKIQAAAASALGDRPGAVVALDPRNGQVLAMVSYPTYNPEQVLTNGQSIFKDAGAPLLNRATSGLYPPGSTFKTVTASAALTDGVVKPDTPLTCPGQLVFDGFPVSCTNAPQGVGTFPFSHFFAFSINAIFAKVGTELGWERLLDMAHAYGFGSSLPFTLQTAQTQVYDHGSQKSKTLLASTAFGQGQILTTPLQMAVVAETIANGGVMEAPHIGLAALDGSRVAENLDNHSSRRIISTDVANAIRDMMVAVVTNGQAEVGVSGIQVAGKTGTAETGVDGNSHAWFLAFAPAQAPTIAVAVIVENGGHGGSVAAPVAGKIIQAALGQ